MSRTLLQPCPDPHTNHHLPCDNIQESNIFSCFATHTRAMKTFKEDNKWFGPSIGPWPEVVHWCRPIQTHRSIIFGGLRQLHFVEWDLASCYNVSRSVSTFIRGHPPLNRFQGVGTDTHYKRQHPHGKSKIVFTPLGSWRIRARFFEISATTASVFVELLQSCNRANQLQLHLALKLQCPTGINCETFLIEPLLAFELPNPFR